MIEGEPASKANGRRNVRIRGISRSIKSQKALNYVDAFRMQCPRLDTLMSGEVSVTMTVFYASRRPDLDESVILDAMQGLIYVNDRQVHEKHVYWGIDRDRPRTHLRIEALHGDHHSSAERRRRAI